MRKTSVCARAATYSSSESAFIERSLMSRLVTRGSKPGLREPFSKDRWYLIGPGMRATRNAISLGVRARGSLPK